MSGRGGGVILLDRRKLVLLVKLRVLGTWEFPGRRARLTETSRRAAARALRVDTGVRLAPGQLLEVCRDDALGVSFTTYVVLLRGRILRFRLRQLALRSYVWCDPHVALALINPAMRHRLAAALVRLAVLESETVDDEDDEEVVT